MFLPFLTKIKKDYFNGGDTEFLSKFVLKKNHKEWREKNRKEEWDTKIAYILKMASQ